MSTAPSFEDLMYAEGYVMLRKLPSGEWAALRKFMFTIGLVVGLDLCGYRTRYCYASPVQAFAALQRWDGQGDPPGPWIKEKGRGLDGSARDRNNPNLQMTALPNVDA